MAFVLLSLNVHGLRDKRKQDFVASLIFNQKADCIFLQETHFTSLSDATRFTSRHNLRGFWSFGTSHSCGVGIVFPSNFSGALGRFSSDIFGRVISLDIVTSNRKLRLVNVYAPNDAKERHQFFQSIDSHMLTPQETILGGDMNCVLDTTLDKQGGDPNSGSKGSDSLRQLVSDCDLVDTWRSLRGSDFEPTWKGRDVLCRLDRFYATSSLAGQLLSTKVLQVGDASYYVSDHSAVQLDFKDLSTIKRGKGTWKLNSSLLDDPSINSDIEALLQKHCTSNEARDGPWWESLKTEVTVFLQEAGKTRAKKKHDELFCLQVVLASLVRGDRLAPNKEAESAIERTKKSIRQLQLNKFEAFRCRSHCNLLDREEQHSRAFFKEHKERSEQSIFDRLTTGDGSVIRDTESILSFCTDYFQDFFRNHEVDTNLWPSLHNQLPQVSKEQASVLDNNFTPADFDLAVKSLKLGRSPGPDGLSAEIYKKYWHIIGPHFTAMVNNCFDSRSLPTSFKEGVITLLCKDEATKEKITSWRPISLLNTDYKIVAKIVNSRLTAAMGSIVHKSQTCAVPGRSVHDNLTTLRDALTYIGIKNISGCLLSLDQKKAFDLLSRLFLFGTIRAFGFGSSLCTKIELLYDGITSTICINGTVSESFRTERGIRQGCPMSPALYVLCIETLACVLRRDTRIRGIPLPGNNNEQYCECLHADDVSTLLTDDRSIKHTLDAFALYGRASGSELNTDKSKILWLGEWSNRTDNPEGIQSTQGGIKILGITFGNEAAIKSNWTTLHHRVQTESEKWKRTDTSFKAKSTILKQVLYPLLWFVSAVFPPSQATMSKIEAILFRFFWHPKATEGVSRVVLKLPIDKGGWNIPCIDAYTRSNFIRNTAKTLNEPNHRGYHFCRYLLGSYAHHVVTDCKEGIFPKSAVIPIFYRNVISNVMRIQRIHQHLRVEDLNNNETYALLKPEPPKPPRRYCNNRPINWEETWRCVYNKNTEPRRLDLDWKVAHSAIPVRQLLSKHGISRTSKCPSCNQEESMEHAFHGCINPAGVWRAVAGLFGIPPIEASTVLYYQPIAVTDDILLPFLLLISEAKYQIWLGRNSALYDNKRINLSDLLNNIRAQIHFRLKCEMERMGKNEFKRKWANPPSICITHDKYIDIIF